MKLSEYAAREGIAYLTAWNWFNRGQIPYPVRQMPSGTILVDVPESTPSSQGVALYARVSSSDQKDDLDRQVSRLMDYATEKGLKVTKVVKEVGSGINGRRKALRGLLTDREIGTIVVEHRDRLARIGFELVESALEASNRNLLVVEEVEVQDDLVRDTIEVLTSFCARLYGRRAAKTRANNAMRAMQECK